MSKLTKEELEEISSLRNSLGTVVTDVGQMALQIQLLEADVSELKIKSAEQSKVFKLLLQKEQELVNRLSAKYGTGTINFETGDYTPEK